jgi:hypothetical protein
MRKGNDYLRKQNRIEIEKVKAVIGQVSADLTGNPYLGLRL